MLSRRLALRFVPYAISYLLLALPFAISSSLAKETSEDRPVGSLGGGVHADPFTGVATTSIPLEVPPGRNGMQPNLALTYNSAAGNGWLGMGWDLEQEGIFRQTKWGVDYSNNTGDKAFTVKMSGVSGDLVPSPPPAPSNQWSAKIEGGFSRIEQLTAGDGQITWKVTTKQGRKHFFGQTTLSRQYDLNNGNGSRIFGWLLDRVEDPDGNYLTYTYWTDTTNNQVYLDHIDYAGNGATAPTNTVKFWLDDGSRPDQGDMYTTNYRIKTKYRVKTLEVKANGNLVRAYKLQYSQSSAGASLLMTVQQFGKDAIVDQQNGIITQGLTLPLPAQTLQYQISANNFETPVNWNTATLLGYTGDSLPRWNGSSCGSGSDCSDLIDMNGDGRPDYVAHYNYSTAQSGLWVLINNGTGFNAPQNWNTATLLGYTGDSLPRWADGASGDYAKLMDMNGDGRLDYVAHYNYSTAQSGLWVAKNGDVAPDLIARFSNGLGSSTNITYASSSNDLSNRVPFPLQRVSAITTCDNWNSATSTCTGISSTTNYSYSGGYYHIGERDLRGVNKTTVTSPAGPNGEQTITETWFHQGNDVTVDANDPSSTVGYTKGLPYRTRVSKVGSPNVPLTETTTSYLPDSDNAAPWFTPAGVVTNILYDNAGQIVKQTQSEVASYDSYGNPTLQYQYGDLGVNGDEQTIERAYGVNTTDWLVGSPTRETFYAGIGTAGQKLSETLTSYDGTGSCSGPNGVATPIKGHVTKVERWLNGGSNPISGMEYNAYGSLSCSRDPNGNTTLLAYDPTSTFALSSTNALGHVTTTTYYGVNGVAMDTGLYGQVKTVTDPNNQTTTSTYDALGRKLTTTTPDGLVATMAYNYGTGFSVGTQHIQSAISGGGLSANLVSKTYFDGLGRTIRKESPGAADGGANLKVLVTETQYDGRGLVKQTSLPYIQGIESAAGRWRTIAYDALGRIIQSTNPDGTSSQVCYNGWTTTTVDPKLHKKVETKDAYGRLITVQEYTGQATSGTCAGGTLYATTTYTYNLVGNLLSVIDHKGNVSSMTYDTLGRKLTMHDPDMGDWSYAYDANGNLLTQVDAKNQKLCFTYDALNRRTQKNYGTTTQTCGTNTVVYSYDDSVAANNGKGRLKQVTDPAQSVTFQYDVRGRISRTDKTLDGVTYTIQSTYDGLGRLLTVSYPTTPATTVSYEYDGPQLKRVYEGGTTYVTYSGWNALGHPGIATAGNGVVTTSTYANSGNATCSQQTFRLCTVKIQKGTNPLYQDLIYNFEANGNVAGITDAVSGNQTFVYDELDRLATANGPYGTFIYTYDEIGNLTSNPQLGLYTYPDSGPMSVRPHAVTAAGNTSYSYDANGNMTSGGGRSYTWNPENKPLTITQGTPPPNGQQAAYAFAEGSGTVTADATGHANTGALSGVTWTAAGKNGSGLSFNGSTGYAQVPDAPSIDISGTALTISFWAKLIDRNDGNDQVLLSKPWWTLGTFDYPYHHYAVEYDDNGGKTADFYFGDTTGQQRGPFSMPVTAGIWAHIAFTYDGATVKGYVNGVLQLTVAETSVIQARGQTLLLGVDGSYNQAAKGTLDDVRIYSRALSQAEIQADMNTPVAPGPPQTTTLVYDGDGGRVKKIVGTTTTRYIGKLYECDNTNCTRFIFAGSQRIATVASNGAMHY